MAQVVNPRLRAEAVLDGILDLQQLRGRMAKVTVDDVLLLLALVDQALAADPLTLARPRITHGRHCTCSACARQDWAEPGLAHCGMHGASCPPVYAPLGLAGDQQGAPR